MVLCKMVEQNPPVTRSEIETFSKRHGIDLPSSYVEFLLRNNGGQPVPSAFPITAFLGNPAGTIQAFFGLNAEIASEDLETILAELGDTIPTGIVPIACTDVDDFLCLDLRKSGGPVVFWDRKPFWGSNLWSEANLYGIASDFESLLMALDEVKSEPD